ncbi:MAG: sulfatase [Haliscomenobacter sp.]|nr:sulfatase [Haliscomenobacter sp.]
MKGSLALIPLLIAFSFPILAQKTADLERNPSARLSEQQKRPNIVVVLVDDMRWDEYGEAGHNYIQTPNIDRLAKEGAAFPNAFATTPLCSPSRASFLTGQYPHTNGITDNTARNAQSHELNTFPKQLHQKGYATAFIGKWHMGNDDSKRPGFDYWVSLKGQGEATDPALNINGTQQKVKGYVTDILIDHSLQFINQERDQPFLLYLAHKALHPNTIQRDDGSVINIGEGDFIPAERHLGLYESAVFNRRPNYNIPPLDKPALMRKIEGVPPLSAETSTKEKTIRDRSEMLMAVDEGLGAILKALEAKGELDNTIVVFTSDHGYWYGEHCLDLERRLAYEEAIRIPMLVRYPPLIKAGIKPEQMVLSIDLASTLLDIAGETPGPLRQGNSWVPIFKENAPAWRKSILIEYYSDTVFPRVFKMGYKAVRDSRYKYIHYVDLEGMNELYDLAEDPYELHNLMDDPGKARILKKMKTQLNRLLTQTGADRLGAFDQ